MRRRPKPAIKSLGLRPIDEDRLLSAGLIAHLAPSCPHCSQVFQGGVKVQCPAGPDAYKGLCYGRRGVDFGPGSSRRHCPYGRCVARKEKVVGQMN
jgi:hypothetical protein